jgi:3alpha(or 20beta)-hydroxysteroid dehydrogenase
MISRMGTLDGKVAIITGAARGMGEAHARRFVQEGARVMVADVLAKEGAAVAGELGDQGFFEPLDVTDMAAWRRVVDATVARWGRVDVLVNNAGIFRILSIADTTPEIWERIMAVNTTGVFLGIQAVAPLMVAQGSGSIVNISSIAGLRGSALSIAYSTSKWAVRGMTKCAAQELAPAGVRVNSVHPGIIDTPMAEEFDAVGIRDAIDARIPIGREARPDEVTPTVVFLASDDSGYCTGGEYLVDGAVSV